MLPRDMVDLMRDMGVFPSILATCDNDGNVHLTFLTWVYPVDERTLRIALSSNATSSKNLQQTGKACIMLIAQDKALSCYGTAKLVKEKIESVKFPVSVFELSVERVENNLFPGGTITGTIPFVHTGDLLKASQLDAAVLEALKNL
ncbi:pyridoxamine 5'-phosphate oxidase-related FMN- binding protein [Thermocrinis albus DSM 14484]|uniref:Pyridoxamine 5'-phosphate oxidase-related FMN-binding protein n=1 Tax=Thermocrinis albus (strain DSM 14484 / JCM 11386 / HI 11/12) TaxID=638303 RepID=D3SQA3_THEAH|nr:pyridoxamine 5'-phosphate oxidase family protein [Thermocrinis albus]ADC89340.1 pyridoxamine 5'-phosphate oxidase-related FMN- binding protein [Thermocrinis albus DSM 14484]